MKRLLNHPFFSFAVIGALLWPAGAWAAAPVVTEAWARPSLGAGRPGVVYFSITGQGTPDFLASVSTPAAGSAEIHRTTMDHGTMHMQPVPGVDIPAKGTLRFSPGGYHLMLMDLQHPLKVGDHFPMTLTFRDAGQQEVDVVVSMGARGLAQAPGGAMAGGAMKDHAMPGMNH